MARRSRSKALPKTKGEVDRGRAPLLTAPQEDHRIALAILLSVFVLLFSSLTITSFLQKSPTVDEPVHLFSGYSYLKWGDFRVNPEHPPLAKVLAALPLLAFDIQDPRPSSPEWNRIPESKPGPPTENIAHDMLFVENDADGLFFYAKLPMIALAILLGIFIYLWSKELFGLEAAIASLFIYSLDPNILAHSQIVHTDIPFTTFFFISTYFFWRALSRLNWTNFLLTSLFFGLAAITKFSFLTIIPIWSILGLFSISSSEPQQCSIGTPHIVSSRWGKGALFAGIFISALITAYLFTWAAYGFRFNAIPGGDRFLSLAPVMSEKPLVKALVSFISGHHLFPEAWIYGQLYILKDLGRATYLLGQISDDGFWLYFPVAFAVKTPLPTLFLLIGTMGSWIFWRRVRLVGLFLVVPMVFYFSVAVWSRMNIGLRHILPIYPFLFVLIGGTAAELWRDKSWVKKGALIFLGAWYLWSSISIYPHYLAFFNELAGGPKNGHKVLLDSNLDWGQDLKGLKRWMDKNGVKKIQSLYFGTGEPEYYGINAFYLPGSMIMHPSTDEQKKPEVPDYLAVSANHLYGSAIFLSEEQEEILRSYRLEQPVTTIGYSILIYKLDLTDPQVYHTMGYILARRGQLKGAVALFRQALRIQPESAEAHAALAQALAMQGKMDEAIRHHNEALRILQSRSQAGRNE